MANETYVHPETRDQVTVLVDSADSAGACFRFEYDARTATPPPEDHAHPEEEHLEVVEGTLHCRLDGTVHVLAAGETLVIPPGAAHAVWHGGSGASRSIGEFRPAGQMQRMLEAFFGVAA